MLANRRRMYKSKQDKKFIQNAWQDFLDTFFVLLTNLCVLDFLGTAIC